jgi:UDP-N-acetylglucosamine:LPS N-acetylglucosamine transferase
MYLEGRTAWVVSANMGLGHNRAAYPFSDIAYGGIYLLGGHKSETEREKFFWRFSRKVYETLSRAFDIPAIGPVFFGIMDRLQRIPPYYPVKDLSSATSQVRFLYMLMKLGLGNSLKRHLNTTPFPVITTFYASALVAEELTDLPVYCIICDADINRAWVPKNPRDSRIVYFVPCRQAKGRLQQYGVPENRIHITGFPLPDEIVGGPDMPILKRNLFSRLNRLDPLDSFRIIHGNEVEQYLGTHNLDIQPRKPVTITYAIGGAGAQKHIADRILLGAEEMIREGKLRINLVAGIKKSVYSYITDKIRKHGLDDTDNITVVYDENMYDYFRKFSEILHTTDILWSKPSELSFYCSLGIPFIISPPIGAHEKGNEKWLKEIGAGIAQPDPEYLGEWLSDYLADGTLARLAWNAFLHTKKTGTYKIKELVKAEIASLPLTTAMNGRVC